MNKVQVSSWWYLLEGAFFNLRERLTGYRREKRIFKEIRGYKLDLKNLSRALEAGGTLTAPLIPWNTSGIFVLTTLGVNAVAYAPYAVICWMTMIVVGIFGYFNITMTKKTPVAIRKEQDEECLT